MMAGEGPALTLVCAGIIFLLLIITGMCLIVYAAMRPKRDSRLHQTSAIEILEKRYAAGDIDRKTFEQIKMDLSP